MQFFVIALVSALPPRAWTFDDTPAGELPAGLTAAVGQWEVVTIDRNGVLAQRVENAEAVLNVALIAEPAPRDVELSVKLRPISGDHDQGGGLI